MCLFTDEIKTAVRELAERTFDEHSFEAYLYNYSALSQTEHEPQFRASTCLVRACYARKRLNAHSFEAYLYNYSALSQTEHEPQRRRAIAQTALR